METNMSLANTPHRMPKQPATFHCSLCPKQFTRAFNLQGHMRTHTEERPFVCTICGKMFTRKNDRKSHELLHTGEKKFVCKVDLANGQQGGCGARFARASNLTRHLKSEKGRNCIKPLVPEEQSQFQVAASALTGLAGSLSAPEQHHQSPPPAQTSLYHHQSIPIEFTTPSFLVFNKEEQLAQPEQHNLERLPTAAPPTLEELEEAIRSMQSYGRLTAKEDGFHGYVSRSLVCPTCHQKVRTRSEFDKHKRKHEKPHHCDVPGCSRTEGFSTLNDVDRHKRSCHPEQRATSKYFRCMVQGCRKKDKKWPREDNFRQHVKRVHGVQVQDADLEDYIYKEAAPLVLNPMDIDTWGTLTFKSVAGFTVEKTQPY